MSEVTIPEIIARTRTTYAGPLEAGEDLMTISIGDTVTVQRYGHLEVADLMSQFLHEKGLDGRDH